jgi:hypothetical protein
MPGYFTSWKEIAQYLGKGVRTVQRWERDGGLPVRHNVAHARHSVLSTPEELDEWVRSRTRGPAGPVAMALRREIAELRTENMELRARLDSTEAAVAARLPVSPAPDESGQVRPESAAIRFAAQQFRAHSVRVRLSLATTMCELSKSRHDGGAALTLGRARQSMMGISSSLQSPGYVPTNEVDELRAALMTLALRIELVAQTLGGNRDAAVLSMPRDAGFVN